MTQCGRSLGPGFTRLGIDQVDGATRLCSPVRMFWNASSTLLASKADVSMNDKRFSPMEQSISARLPDIAYIAWKLPRTCKGFGLLRRHRPEMPQITLVSHKHDHDINIGMVSQLFQPPVHILVSLVLANVVDEKGANSAAIVGRRDGPIALLSCSVPNLCLDRLGIDLDRPGGELDPDRRLGVYVELVPGESTQQVGLSNTGVSNQNHWAIRRQQSLVSS